MAHRPLVKICGISTAPTLAAALDAGADMVGFVFFGPSPRNVTPAAAAALAARVEGRARKVALTVDADDATIDAIVTALRPDLLQLHGREAPARAAALRARTGLPVMKALGVSTAADLAPVGAYEGAVDWLLFDAKPPKDATRPGGNALAFDWTILDGLKTGLPWLLSGGLDPLNVAEALTMTRAPGVDVSSGVESAPGVKDEAKIRAFVRAARGLS
ncbi:MAG: phosphoribosylanthranilate isomerase [Hyphomicrobiales bacterium]|nr:phosphoribosylanthranilate isomerase [Hyphomicrobiales bacterium]